LTLRSVAEEKEVEVLKIKTSRPAREYKVTQINGNARASTGSDLVTLSIQEAKRKKTSFLLDTGATLTLIKLRNLKNETPKREKRMILTGHKIHTIYKIRVPILVRNRRIRHTIYMMKNDFPINYERILGIDFLQKQATCNLEARSDFARRDIKTSVLRKISIKTRSETIIQAITYLRRNRKSGKNNAKDIHWKLFGKGTYEKKVHTRLA